MKKLKIIFLLMVLISCSKEEPVKPEFNATVIGYDSRKCYCLYGWKIIKGNDTILTSSPIMGEIIGYKVNYPVQVNIETVPTDDFCRYPYHEVISISKYERPGIIKTGN